MIVAKHAGFCFGVRRAVEAAREAAPAWTLGPVIHNPRVVRELADMGVVSADAPEDIPEGAVAVVRSHGVGRETLSRLRARAREVCDATCPFVTRIHEMAQEAEAQGVPLIVVGEAHHPEVEGIRGWTRGESYAVADVESARALPEMERALAVSQTTFILERFERVCAALKERVRDLEIRRTICPATRERQEEAVQLAKSVDVMLVVGGRESSNSRKLFELVRAVCPRAHFIEGAREVENTWFHAADRIGITAGASTPDCTIKEVAARMNDIEKQVTPSEEQQAEANSTESDFMADVEKSMVQLRPGQTITGTVVQITNDEVCVNVGYKADGLVKKADLSSTDVKVGDEIEVEVVKVNDGEGNVLLSQRNIVNRKIWDEIMAKYESGEYVTGTGKEAVKGGLLADVMGIRCFIPASQLSLRYVEKIEEFVGQELTLQIIEVDKPKKRIVASRKKVLLAEEAERKKAIWDALEVGSVVKGVVRRLADFGAFVDIGGVDGLVHVTDLSWGRVQHPSDVVKVGDEIDVKILNVDPARERISLSYKQTRPRPWTVAGEKYPVGSIVEGKVVRITTFGAFVELEPGLDGLVHISQCALTRIAKVEDAVNVGDIVRVKVLDVNTEAKRISLSIKEVLEDEAMEQMPASNDLDEYAIVDVPEAIEDEPEAVPVEIPTAEAETEEAPAGE